MSCLPEQATIKQSIYSSTFAYIFSPCLKVCNTHVNRQKLNTTTDQQIDFT